MARGTQFLALRTRLRAELKRSSSIAVGVEDVDVLNETINSVYSALYMSRDWPHLQKEFSLPLSAGERYYNTPTGLNTERVLEAWTLLSGLRTPLTRGIGQEDYAAYDPVADERTEPSLKWDVRWTGSTDQIEIWPIPSSNNQTAKFDGFQSISRLTSDTDQCLLDDTLIVLFSSARLKKGEESEKDLNLAQQHLNNLVGRALGRDGGRLGLGGYGDRSPKIVVRVS